MNRIDIQLKGVTDNPCIYVGDENLHQVITQLQSDTGVTVQEGDYNGKVLELHIKNGEVQMFIVERGVKAN